MKVQSKTFYTFMVFVVAYTCLTLLPAPARTTLMKYHLSAARLRLLDFTLMIPLIAAWFAVFYGYAKLQRYGQLIKGNQDGTQVNRMARGLFVLAIGLPLGSIISSTLVLIARSHPALTASSIIIPNYFNALYALLAFCFIYVGARALNEQTRIRPTTGLGHGVVLAVIIIGVIFCDLIARQHVTIRSTYHMSYSLVMLTLAIPYIYTWFLGLYAIAEMYAYSKQVAGIIYRKGWDRLAFGLGSIIVVDILLQYLGTLSSWLNSLHLAGLLLLLYVLLFLLAGGFIVVALGTRQLMKIEEA